MGSPKILDGNVISDSDPLQVTTTATDPGNVALGTAGDASSANTVIGLLKKLASLLPTALGSATSANSLPVVIASDQGAVTGIEAGSSSSPDNGIVSVANTSTQIMAAAGGGITKRQALLYNTGTQTVSLRYGAAPTAGTHFPLIAGAALRVSTLLAVNGIVASGTCNVAVISEAR